MLEFLVEDPFPLTAVGPGNYPAAKRHAEKVDDWLGLDVPAVEASIQALPDGQERWIEHAPAVFLTPYVELRAWLEELRPRPGETVVDLGAGYGRLGFVMARHFPGSSFLGFELVGERVKAGAEALARFGAGNARLLAADISSPAWRPPPAEIYFIYDYGTKAAIAKTLADLRDLSKERGIRVVGRGRAVRDQVEKEHPWLGSVHRSLVRDHYTIYRSFA
jgi:hypothetical protein